MISKLFVLGDLQQVYEMILNKKLLDPAFRRIIADKVEKTEFVKGGARHRPLALFGYKKILNRLVYFFASSWRWSIETVVFIASGKGLIVPGIFTR